MSNVQTVEHLKQVMDDNSRTIEERAKAETTLAELYLIAYPMPEWCKERLIDSIAELDTLEYIYRELINRYQVVDEGEPSFQWISAAN